MFEIIPPTAPPAFVSKSTKPRPCPPPLTALQLPPVLPPVLPPALPPVLHVRRKPSAVLVVKVPPCPLRCRRR